MKEYIIKAAISFSISLFCILIGLKYSLQEWILYILVPSVFHFLYCVKRVEIIQEERYKRVKGGNDEEYW